jgi:hypothetical protein
LCRALQSFVEFLSELHSLTVSNVALTRQAKQVSASYEALLDEKIAADKKASTGGRKNSAGSAAAGGDAIAVSKKIAELEDLLRRRDAEIKLQAQELESCKAQLVTTKRQLEDYDFMFGDMRKKKD